MEKIIKFINSKYFFIAVLCLFILLYIGLNFNNNYGDLSSDFWMEKYLDANRDQPSQVSSAVSREKFYIVPYLFDYLSPELGKNIYVYHLLTILIISLVYVVSGLVVKKVFGSWLLASLAGVALLMPRYVFSTHIGMLNFRNLRGLAFAFPFYFLLSYYWIIYGIKDKYKNILLGITAGVLVYLYPPVGIVIVPMFILTALIIYRRKFFKEIVIFSVVYLIVSSVFWFGYLFSSNPASMALLGQTVSLNDEEMALRTEILHYRIPDISITGIELGTLKRSIWDGFPLLVAFLLSLYLVKKYRDKLDDKQLTFFKVGVIFTIIILLFAVFIEFVNSFMQSYDKPPIFIEHLRLLRALGFMWIGQAIFVVFAYHKILGRKLLTVFFSLVLILSPLSISAPLVRKVVRATVPESIRIKYNLAPVVPESDVRSYKNLEEVALWAKDNLLINKIKVFVFDDFQNEFKFKVLNGHSTNLTGKEGAIYLSTGFENSKIWYEERMRYNEVVDNAKDFSEIVDFAKELECTHILLPRGDLSSLYESNIPENIWVVYSNDDYKLLEIR